MSGESLSSEDGPTAAEYRKLQSPSGAQLPQLRLKTIEGWLVWVANSAFVGAATLQNGLAHVGTPVASQVTRGIWMEAEAD